MGCLRELSSPVILVVAMAAAAAANTPSHQVVPAVPPPVQGDASPQARYPDFYFRNYFNHERSGVVAEDSFEEDTSSASSEQVVSYSYLAAPQGHSKDVVYGSGSAAKPPSSDHTFSARSPSLGHTISAQSRISGHTTIAQSTTATPPVFAAFESSKLSHQTPPSFQFSSSPSFQSSSSPSFQSSSSPSAPSSFFSSSFSPSPAFPSTPSPSLQSFSPATTFGHSGISFAVHQAPPDTIHPAEPSHFIIKDSTFQPFPGAPTFTVPLPVPHNHITGHPTVASQKQEQLVQAGSDAQSSYLSYEKPNQGGTERPIYQRVMDPFRDMGQRIYKAAYPVLQPMMKAGHKLSERLKLNNMNKYISRTVDSEALPVVAGVGALSAIGLAVIAVAASTNATNFVGKRSIEDDPTSYFLNKMEYEEAVGEGRLGKLLDTPQLTHSSSPWCSKRVFCDAMTYLPDDYLFSFEKRLELFLEMLGNGKDEESPLKETADSFVKAVRQRRCDQYTCGDERVDSSQILTDTSGPR
ncbi:uncharacterized protein LOC126983776 isoform X2 [Eriocheir sinensis]|uniref:uncharacterized protein LOC126983776 isoform X2 n=1 Tax=Eriocheir sinensis TaxID=95602 RepID=UPI0021C8742F|nr:uncharacterized protein LOC126983776 isoform X2 [Eriocheir sinensis]